MKKIVILSLFVAALFTSCSDSLLDLNNPNALVAQNSWQTQTDIENGLTGCYHTLYNSFYNSFNAFLISGQSDEFYSQSPDADLVDYVMLKYSNPDQRWNINAWMYLYQSVFRCNQVIVYADEVEWKSEQEKANIVAQARAIRGMGYYYLAMLWKKAPIVDWISSPADQPAEATFEELVAFIESDFKYAADNLKDSYPGEPGRVNKYFAYSFLGKLYMNSNQWAKAKEALAVVVNSGKFQLVDTYRDNFKHTTENNAESIWEIQHSDENQTMGGYWGIPNDGAVVCFASYREKFLTGYPYGWGDYAAYDWIVDMYKDERNKDGGYDIRLRDNIVYPEFFNDFPGELVYMKESSWNATNWSQMSWCRKYTTDYYRSDVTFYSPINARILRYGEILMSYAECIVETEGEAGISKAAEYVNMVRERANLYPLAESVHKDCLKNANDFKKRLYIEREKEICFEYDRFFDLRRWGLGTNDAFTNEVKSRSSKFAANFINGHEWLPIPLAETSNNPNLSQNESY